jgi:hypothetical protein
VVIAVDEPKGQIKQQVDDPGLYRAGDFAQEFFYAGPDPGECPRFGEK